MSGIIGKSPNMRSGAVGKYPTGHVLQTVTYNYYRTVHWWTNSSTYYQIGSSGGGSGATGTLFELPAMTPKSANSKIIVEAMLFMHGQEGTTKGQFALYKDSSAVTNQVSGHIGVGGGDATVSTYLLPYLLFEDASPGTGSRVYKLYCRRYDGSNKTYIHEAGMNSMVAREIQQ